MEVRLLLSRGKDVIDSADLGFMAEKSAGIYAVKIAIEPQKYIFDYISADPSKRSNQCPTSCGGSREVVFTLSERSALVKKCH